MHRSMQKDKPTAGFEPTIARLEVERLNHWATRAAVSALSFWFDKST